MSDPTPKCPDCLGTGVAGDNGPGKQNAIHEWVPCDCPAGGRYRTEPSLELQLAKCQKELAAAREEIATRRNGDLESDSIVASCSCMTKTNEARFHKPGCKYRLIMERDAVSQIALQAAENFMAILKEKNEEIAELRKANGLSLKDRILQNRNTL